MMLQIKYQKALRHSRLHPMKSEQEMFLGRILGPAMQTATEIETTNCDHSATGLLLQLHF